MSLTFGSSISIGKPNRFDTNSWIDSKKDSVLTSKPAFPAITLATQGTVTHHGEYSPHTSGTCCQELSHRLSATQRDGQAVFDRAAFRRDTFRNGRWRTGSSWPDAPDEKAAGR